MRVALIFLVSEVFVFSAPFPTADSNGIEVHAIPNPVTNGSTVMLQIDTRNLTDPIVGIQAWHGKRAIAVYPHPLKGSAVFIGFIGVSYYHKPEIVNVKLEWTDRSGYHFMQVPIEIIGGQFIKERLRVPKRKVSPSKTDRRRIVDERISVKDVYNTPHLTRLWTAEFSMPATGKITSPFGSQRVLNGRFNSYHSGVDFRAPTGTPIYAANDGIVRFARNLFYSGNHLIIDHGLGIFTGYSHLSEFSAKRGQRVFRGEEIGRAGATGRANGPHLHWSAKINGVSVDPLQLKELVDSLFVQPEEAPVTESK